MGTIVKLFSDGHHQIVILPAQYCFDAEEVLISRSKNGDIILSPRPVDWQGFLSLESLDTDLSRIKDDD